MQTPVISVIIPAYNSARFIRDTLDSVFSQTYRHFETVVINDGSPDTEELENELRPYLNRIVYVKQGNRGVSSARNAGIQRASGEYIAFLDSDDLWLPQFLESQMNFLQRGPVLDFAYSDGLFFGDGPCSGKRVMEVYPSAGPVTFESLLLDRCHISTSGIAAKRQVLLDAGLFDETLSHAEDFDLWLRVAHRGARMAYQTSVLWKCRLRPGSLSTLDTQMLAGDVAVLTKVERTLELDAKLRLALRALIQRACAYRELEHGRRCLVEGRFEEARRSFTSANGYLRRNKIRVVLAGLKCAPALTRAVARMWGEVLAVFARLKWRHTGLPQLRLP